MKQIIMPFSGFYNTIHGDNIDEWVQQKIADGQTQCWATNLDYNKARKLYAKEYVNKFNEAMRQEISGHYCNTTFDFYKLKSPREYNFANDIIVGQCTTTMIGIMMSRLDWQNLAELVKEQLAERSGFVPSYSNYIGDWHNWTQWDANQLGLALQSWADLELGQGWQHKHIEILVNEVLDELLLTETMK